VDPTLIEGAIHYLASSKTVRLGRSSDYVDVPSLSELGPYYHSNLLLGQTPTLEVWDNNPTSPGNATDGVEANITGWGDKALGGAGEVGRFVFSFPDQKRVVAAARVGVKTSAGNISGKWQWSNDAASWSDISDSLSASGAAETLLFMQSRIVNAKYLRLTFSVDAAATGYARLYEAYALEQGAPDPVPSSPPSFDPRLYYGSGWGGYESDVDEVDDELGGIVGDAQHTMRYWCMQHWYRLLKGYGANREFSTAICDALVAYAEANDMVLYIDCAHNSPPEAYISGHETDWKNELLTVADRYNASSNVVIEIWNENWGMTPSDEVALAEEGIDHLRDNGITLPLLINLSWTRSCCLLNDALNDYAIGRHFYPSHACAWATHSVSPKPSLAHLVAEAYASGASVAATMQKYWRSTSETYYVQRAYALGIPNGFCITELGPGDSAENDARLKDPRSFGMAYHMQMLREAKDWSTDHPNFPTPVASYRIGNLSGESKRTLYKSRATDLTSEASLYPP
jgi:hypothetical protein